jgi:hypothetical protein
MISRTAIIRSDSRYAQAGFNPPPARAGQVRMPPGALEDGAERINGDAAFGDDVALAQHHRDSEVVEAQQLRVGIYVASRHADSQGAKRGSRVFAEMAALPSYEFDIRQHD